MTHLLGDVRYAVRLLARSPAYTLVATTVLAIGIAANTVAFGYFKAFALTPLPGVSGSARFHTLGTRTNGGRIDGLSLRDFRDAQRRFVVYDGIAGTNFTAFSLGRGASARRVYGELVTGTYFGVLGVQTVLGRALLPSDDLAPRAHPVVVLAHGLWRDAFGADPSVIGRTIELNTVPMTVVGVAAPAFHGTVVGIDIQLFVPVMMQPALSGGFNALDDPDIPLLFGVARPGPGTSLAEARADAARVGALLDADRPSGELGERAVVMPLRDSPQGLQTYGGPLVWLMGATALLLLVVVCANVAGLALVRTVARRGEIAARLALGASRPRIARLLVVEALLLAMPGAALGLWMPRFADPYITDARNALSVPIYIETGSGAFAVAALLLAFLSAVLTGLVPGVTASRIDLATTMKDALSPRGASTSRLRTGLVLAQVAMSVVLLVGTALIVRSLDAARDAHPGFDPRGVASIVVDVRPAGHQPDAGFAFYRRLLDGLRSIDGVESVSLLRTPLLMVWDFGRRPFSIGGHAPRPDQDMEFGFNIIGPDHFRTLRIPLVAGRDFQYEEPATRVAIVNETLARRFWGEPAAAIGRRIETADWTTRTPVSITVVGVAQDIKYTRLNEEAQPYVYLPFSQAYSPMMAVHVRARPGPLLLDRLRRYVTTLDPNVLVVESRMLVEQTNLGFALYDTAARVLGVIGIAAVALAALGVYGLVAYTVKQSTHEIGIRMAIGAPRAHIVQKYLSGGVRLGAVGVAIGIALALGSSRLLAALLYGVSATDLASFAAATAVVLGAAVAASFLPAWRASRVDPLIALRRQ